MARPLRYGFIIGAVVLCAGLAAAGGWRYARASSPVNGPIILISIDSLRADHLPVYGYTHVATPAIDMLAADGVVFDRAYAHSPETLPSHVSLLTGRLPVDTGIRDDVGFVVKEGERLLARLLRERGYATAGIVSTFALRKDTGIGQGFSVFDDRMSPAAPDQAIGEIARDSADSERAAEQWLDESGNGRCFLFLQLGDQPGAPVTTPAQEALSAYDSKVAHADEVVGRLLKYLKTHQLYDRSTIVLTSDHGEELGEHGERGHGLFVYEESLRVPLIVKQAAGEGAGRRVADLVQHVDVVPTLLDLAKAPDPGGLRGQTLKPLLDGTGHFGERTAYGESLFGRYHFGWHELTTITDGKYRYIRAPREELYDLRRDVREARNLIDDPSATAALSTLRTGLDRFKATAPPMPAVSEEDRARLEALGNVGRLATDLPDEPLDPKDMYRVVAVYREAVELGRTRQWLEAIERLQEIVRENPSIADVWREIASFAFDAERYEQSVDAYKHVAALEPLNPSPHLGAATALVRLRKLDDAKRQAEQAAMLADDKDAFSRSSAHEWLARIALTRRDADTAREEAAAAKAADPKIPLPLYVDARVDYDQGHYADALPVFEQAVAEEKTAHGRPLLDLHYFYADTLVHLQRGDEAEYELGIELKAFPKNTRARGALATLLHNAGRDEEAAAVMDDLVRISPTPDTYTLAARLWTSFGDRKQAAAARAQAARLAAHPSQAAH